MNKPALRKNRFEKPAFKETSWTSSSKNIGQYLFRRISLDQSNKKLQELRPRHIMSQLIVSTKELNEYVNDYLHMMEKRNKNKPTNSSKKAINVSIDNQAHNHIHVSSKV
tara:strand:- start:183 stop:512 length:330 start_codon:yes stop_codon:yes gene_type:complete